MAGATRQIIVLGLAILVSAALVRAQPENPESRTYAQEFHPPLVGKGEPIPGLVVYGPDASECVRFEPNGLRITLPAGYPRPRPGTGVVTDFGVRGDFEITLGFEVIQEPEAEPGEPTANVSLMIVPRERPDPGVWYKANQNRASFARQSAALDDVGRFFALSTKWNELTEKDQWGNPIFDKKEERKTGSFLAKEPSGRLRLVRTGARLDFLASDGASKQFTQVYTDVFGKKDLKNVRVLAATAGPGVSWDVRITDLHIRAESLLKATGPVTPTPTAPGFDPLLIFMAIGAVFLVLASALGAWLLLRKRAAPAKPTLHAGLPAIAFICNGCGKALRAKAERAGKKVKCPQCGAAVAVPDADVEEAEEAS